VADGFGRGDLLAVHKGQSGWTTKEPSNKGSNHGKTTMNTEYLTQRRKGAKGLFEEAGKFLVKGAGQQGADMDGKRLVAREGYDFFMMSHAQMCGLLYCRVGTVKVGEHLMSAPVFWNEPTINPEAEFYGKESSLFILVNVVAVTSAAKTGNKFALFRVVGDALDGFFHGKSRFEFAPRFNNCRRSAKFVPQLLRAVCNAAVPYTGGFLVATSAIGNRAGIDTALSAFNRQLKFIAANSTAELRLSTAKRTRKQNDFGTSFGYNRCSTSNNFHVAVEFLGSLFRFGSLFHEGRMA
jgi:hypothetical protein